MLLSVIIPTLNGASTLPFVFRCLASQTLARDRFEVIVVDDGSTDSTPTLLRGPEPGFSMTALKHPCCLGRSAARNTGCGRAKGDLLVFLDADTLPVPEWLDSYARSFADSGDDVLVGGHNYIEIPADAEPASWLESRMGASDGSSRFTRANFKDLHSLSKPGQWRYADGVLSRRELEMPHICRLFPNSLLCAYSLITSNAAVRRTAFEHTRGFDPFIRRGQDTELGLRLWQHGCSFRCIANAGTYHLYTPSAERRLTAPERLSYFYRHPYRLVHAMMCRQPQDSMFELLHRCNTQEADEEALGELGGHAIDFRYCRSEIEPYLLAHFAGQEETVRRALDEAKRGGLVTGWKDDSPRFDLCLTANWIRDRAPGVAQTEPFEEHVYACNWQLSIATSVFRGLPPDLSWTLPVPSIHNKSLRFTQWNPPRLAGYLDAEAGVLQDVPVRMMKDSLSFQFTMRVSRPEDKAPGICHTNMATADSDSDITQLRQMLARIGDRPDDRPGERVRRIYDWMSKYVLHRCNTFDTSFVVDSGFGHEYQRACLFARLSRLAGVDVRVMTGAVFPSGDVSGLDIEERQITASVNPLGQIWATVHLPGEEALAIDFRDVYQPWPTGRWNGGYRVATASPQFSTIHPRSWNADANCWREVAVPAIFAMTTRLERVRTSRPPIPRAVHA